MSGEPKQLIYVFSSICSFLPVLFLVGGQVRRLEQLQRLKSKHLKCTGNGKGSN